MSEVFFEDLKPGQIFTSTTIRVDPSEIKAFAAQYDPQPFHLNESAAQNTFSRGLAASGWHTAALTMKLLVGSAILSQLADLSVQAWRSFAGRGRFALAMCSN